MNCPHSYGKHYHFLLLQSHSPTPLFVLQATKAGVQAWERGYYCKQQKLGCKPGNEATTASNKSWGASLGTRLLLQATKAGVQAWERG